MTPDVAMTPEHEEHLNNLSDAGETNALVATNSLMKQFPELKKSQAVGILKQWVEKVQREAMQ